MIALNLIKRTLQGHSCGLSKIERERERERETEREVERERQLEEGEL